MKLSLNAGKGPFRLSTFEQLVYTCWPGGKFPPVLTFSHPCRLKIKYLVHFSGREPRKVARGPGPFIRISPHLCVCVHPCRRLEAHPAQKCGGACRRAWRRRPTAESSSASFFCRPGNFCVDIFVFIFDVSNICSCGQVDDTAVRCSPYLKQLAGGSDLPSPSADTFKKLGGSTETFRVSAGACLDEWCCVLGKCSSWQGFTQGEVSCTISRMVCLCVTCVFMCMCMRCLRRRSRAGQ